MLAIKIDNPEIEQRFEEYIKTQKKSHKEVVSEAMKFFLDTHSKDDGPEYIKRDPTKHLHTVKRSYEDKFCDDIALTHIEDSAQYIHNLRRKRNYE